MRRPEARAAPRGIAPGEFLAALASVALVVSVFLPWFGVDLGPIGVSASGLKVHDYLWIVVVLSAAELLLLARTGGAASDRSRVSRQAVVAELAFLNLVIVLVAFFTKGASDAVWRDGAVLGIAAAALGALGALLQASPRRAVA